MKRLIPFLIACCLTTTAAAQNGDLSSAVAMRFFANPANYLMPFDTLRLLEPSVGSDHSQRLSFFNDLATYSSFVGEYHASLRCFDSLPGTRHRPAQRFLSGISTATGPPARKKQLFAWPLRDR